MDSTGNNPGNWIGNIQHPKTSVNLKRSKNPHNPQAAGTDQRNNHWHQRITDTSECPHHCIHNAAKK